MLIITFIESFCKVWVDIRHPVLRLWGVLNDFLILNCSLMFLYFKRFPLVMLIISFIESPRKVGVDIRHLVLRFWIVLNGFLCKI